MAGKTDIAKCFFGLCLLAFAFSVNACGTEKNPPQSSTDVPVTEKASGRASDFRFTPDMLAAAQTNFRNWIEVFRVEAIAAGISPAVFDEALQNARLDPRILESDSSQPEFVKPVWEYLAGAVTSDRIQKGQLLMQDNAVLLEGIEARYGVDRKIVTAIWGLETNFGSFKGSYLVPHALASLAYQGRRVAYGRSQLMAALQILQAKDIAAKDMVGSWAGAMGHTQLIPTTYLSHAVDADGDGRRDIWMSVADALSSTANYLSASGWDRGLAWGEEVVLPQGFDYALADDVIRKPVSAWNALRVRSTTGGSVSIAPAEIARLILPAGHRGPAFLVTRNFDAVTIYNNSISYALAVTSLASRMGGAAPFQAGWPVSERPLNKSEREEVQSRLNARGYHVGAVDGLIGKDTRAAIRLFQSASALPADGYANQVLLERLRQPD